MSNHVALMNTADDVIDRFDKLSIKRRALVSEASRRETRIEDLMLDMQRHSDDIAVLNSSVVVVKEIIDMLAVGGKQELESMLTYGVGAIFTDREYSIRIDIDDRGNDKKATLWLIDTSGEVLIESKLYEGNGGGLAAVASMMIRVYLICEFKRKRFVFLDESMSELSIDFVDSFLAFLRLMVEKLKFVIILITHDARFMPEADKVYRVEKGIFRLMKGAT